MLNDLQGRSVLITGGTRGIGLATGLAFGRRGADVTLTCRWGSADVDAIEALFRVSGAPPPTIVEANVTSEAETAAVLDRIAERHDRVHAFVSNVGFAQLVRSFADYNARGLAQSIEYGAWPLASHLMALKERFGAWPRYAVAMSSCGPQEYHVNYDFAAASKAVLETLVRYLAHRLFEGECRVNAVRARWVDTSSLTATIGEDFVPFTEQFNTPGLLQTPEEVGNVVLAICSGLLDGMRGQVVTVDHGTGFYDNIMRLYADRARHAPERSQREQARDSQHRPQVSGPRDRRHRS